MTRRQWLAATPAAAALASSLPQAAEAAPMDDAFRFCLNTSTISGQKLGLEREIEITAQAGYHAIEPWLRDIDAYADAGKSLKDLGKKIADLGLTVESSIGFFEWIVDDDARRAKALEQAKRDMDRVKQIGGKRIAAPASGATDRSDMNLLKIADRYRALLELGDKMDVVPELEVWGFSKTLTRLSDAAYVAIAANHPKACILADVYHLYKGGSDFAGIHLLNGKSLPVLHFNDYPANPRRSEISDAQRVYPGDGVAPLTEILHTLQEIGFHGYLSLELFNKEYWKHDALEVARTGLEKMKAAVHAATAK